MRSCFTGSWRAKKGPMAARMIMDETIMNPAKAALSFFSLCRIETNPLRLIHVSPCGLTNAYPGVEVGVEDVND